MSKDSRSMSYKTLLEKSLEEDPPLHPETNKARPVPPPRVDLIGSRSSTQDVLSMKLMEQADQFEKSSSRESSPSLNELRDLAKTQRPVPVRRSKKPGTPLTQQGMVWYDVVWYGMVWCSVVWCGMVWYGMVWCSVVWYGVVWCGMVWCGVVWYGVVWCGVVWYGVV